MISTSHTHTVDVVSYNCDKHGGAVLFIPVPAQLLWEVFSHAAIAARRLFVHISTTVCIVRYCIQLSELWQTRQRFEETAVGFETGFLRLRVNWYAIAPHVHTMRMYKDVGHNTELSCFSMVAHPSPRPE